MKNSELLKEQLSQEDNDLVALGLHNKILREERIERFEEEWLEKATSSPNLVQYQIGNNNYIFWLKNGNIIDFYPKANKLLIRKKNKWIKPGLKWLIKELNLIK